MKTIPFTAVKMVRHLRQGTSRAWLSIRSISRAALSSPGTTLTLLFGLLAFLISTAALWRNLLPTSDSSLPVLSQRLSLILLILLGLGIIGILVSGRFALAKADSQLYAKILLSGRSVHEIFYIIAKDIRRTCRKLERLLERAPLPFPPDAKRKHSVDTFILRLRRHITQQHKKLKRLERLKKLAANELDIPARRLCDHVFQYSPSIHDNRVRAYLRYWKQVGSGWQSSDPLQIHEPYLTNTTKRIEFQDQLVAHQDLHWFIRELASIHSTSGSLQTYVEALGQVARTYLDTVNTYLLFPWERAALKKELSDRLLFIIRKQKAHPGFDLHSLLLQYLNTSDEDKGTSASRLNTFLQRVRDHSSRLTVGDSGPLSRTSSIERRARTLLEDYSDEDIENILEDLVQLPMEISKRIGAMRSEIREQFWGLYREWFSGLGNDQLPYVVTHGYSQTVRAVLEPPDRETAAQPSQRWGSSTDDFKLFFMLPGNEDSLDTRVIEYELKENERFRHDRLMAAGPWSILAELLEKGDRVLIVLGAECFDSKRRVVHARGIADELACFLTKLQDSKHYIPAVVVVVAESYKARPETLASDVHFFGQHFDRVDLYPAECIDIIITEKKIYAADAAEDWRKILKKKRKT